MTQIALDLAEAYPFVFSSCMCESYKKQEMLAVAVSKPIVVLCLRSRGYGRRPNHTRQRSGKQDHRTERRGLS